MNESQLLDWAASLSEDEATYLLAVASSEHETTLARASGQDSRIVAIFGWSLVGVGTLAVTETIDFGLGLQGVASMSAVASAILVLLGGMYALWPRELSLGVGAKSFSAIDGPTKQEMQAYVLVSLLIAIDINDRLLSRRALALKAMIAALLAEVLLVILTSVAAVA